MYKLSAEYYDKVYSFKDYAAEARRIHEWIARFCQSGGRALLDIACGTGRHLAYLRVDFEVEGLDRSPGMLREAAKRYPDLAFHRGDMRRFDLKKQFDVVTSLFSSVGYLLTLKDYTRAITCMTRHLKPGGVLLVEPWLKPDVWTPGRPHVLVVDEPELKIARLNTTWQKGRKSGFDFHYTIATPEGVSHFVEKHVLALYTPEEQLEAFRQAGLEAQYDETGLTGRGMLIGVKP